MVKKREKKREDDLHLQQGKKTLENCDTRTYDVIKRNFETSSSHEINLLKIALATLFWKFPVLSSIF